MRYGRTDDLYNWSLAFVGIKLLSRISTPILWLAILHVISICTSLYEPQAYLLINEVLQEQSLEFSLMYLDEKQQVKFSLHSDH